MTLEEMIARCQAALQNKRVRQCISRGAMLFVSLVLLYWGYKCLHTAVDLHDDRERDQSDMLGHSYWWW